MDFRKVDVRSVIFLTVIWTLTQVTSAQRNTGVKCIYCASGCNNVTGMCEKCLDGLYGPKCELTCKSSCRNCDKNTGKCITCLDGWYGEDCSLQCHNCHLCEKETGRCTLCPPTSWGDSCQNFCSQNCHACNATNGECIVCAVGFYGQKCDKQCGNCKRNICERLTGACVYECTSGWHGPTCDRPCLDNCLMCDKQTGNCIMCKGGLWGESCTLKCKENCDFCNITNGNCVECKVGYYGKNCQENCGHCNQEACDKETGECLYQCKDGYFGLKCDNKCMENCTRCSFRDSCLVCKAGLTGKTCDIQCPSVCQSCHVDEFTNKIMCSECKAETRLPHRNCTCSDKKCLRFNTGQDGFGRSCEECESGTGWFWYQGTCCPCVNCEGGTEQCSVNGTCLQGCKPGYYPKKEGCHLECDIPNCLWCEPFFSYGKVCVGCADGYYPSGGACAKCNENCKNGLCNNKTGECLDGCLDGWYGIRCDTRCDFSRCDSCDEDLGHCTSCKIGHWGRNCQHQCSENCIRCYQETGECIQCSGNFFGSNCSGTCDNCVDEKCNKVNGQCYLGCKSGYYGQLCENPCLPGCAICENRTSCATCKSGLLYKNGICAQQCINCTDVQCDDNGFCQKGCVSGHYGPKCMGICPLGCDQCDKENTCDACLSSYRMKNGICISACENCVNGSCDRDGKCTLGCLDGWFGEDCNRECMGGCRKCITANLCIDCKPNYKLIGSTCVRHCPNCLLGDCNNQFDCTLGCNFKWYGPKCDKQCSNGCVSCISDRECRECGHGMTISEGVCYAACENCKKKECIGDGFCVNGCKKGWYDGKCNKRCPEGCASCPSYKECTSCEAGYSLSGVKCEKKCLNCLQESCDENGVCNLGCKDGWYGFLCHSKCSNECKTCHDGHICVSCADGKYGLQCENSCPATCISCELDKTTKKLICNSCKRGYSVPEKECSCTNTKCVKFTPSSKDKKCSMCTEGWYPNKDGLCCPCVHCTGGNNVCNGTSACVSGCISGWTSPSTGCDIRCELDRCTECILNDEKQNECKECQDGYYLENKNKCIPCSTHCGGANHLCDHLTGKCLEGCEPGWKGDRCNAAYIKIPFVSVCHTSCLTCNQTNGVCKGCKDGFWGSHCEKTCSSTCLKGCNQETGSCYTSCSRYCYIKEKDNNPSCNITTGECYHGCVNGWRGYECRDKCGINCFDHSCNRFTGKCTKGCDQGWQGEMCSETKALIVLPSIGLIAGGVTAAIVFIFLMTFLIFFIYKCRTKKKEREGNSEAVRHPNTTHVNHGMLMDSVM